MPFFLLSPLLIYSLCPGIKYFILPCVGPVTEQTNIYFKITAIVREKGGMTVADTPQLTIYTLEHCPNCELLKEYLKGHMVPYQERDMSTADSLTELRINGVFVNEAPVLQKGDVFLTSADLFSKGDVREEHLTRLFEGA
jgi:glutaredoxin